MAVGVFYAWDFLVLIAMTVCYWHCPVRFIEKKQEYVKFALLFLSVYFFIFLVLRNICGWEDAVVHGFGGFCCSLVYGWGIVFTRSVQ